MGRNPFGIEDKDTPQGGKLRVKRSLRKHEEWVEAVLPADAEAGVLETETNRQPLLALGVAVAVVMVVLGGRLFSLQIVQGARNLGLAEGNRIRQKYTRAPRGVIYDRNQVVLARNQASYDVTVVSQLLPKNEAERVAVYQRLSQIIATPAAEISEKSESKGLNQPQPQLVTANIDRDRALLLDQSGQDLPGFSLDVNPIREYPATPSLAHILGYTGRVSQPELTSLRGYLPTDYIGKLGIEKRYELDLKGQNGSEQTEVDATGRPVKVLASRPSVPGSNMVLSIDSGLQNKLTESIQAQLTASGSTRGSGVAINPKTGEVLASVSLPGYDNNLFSRGISQKDYSALAGNPAQPLFNKAISGAYPTGSVIKPLVAAAALQERVVTPYTTVNDTGALEVPHRYDPNIKYTFRSYDAGGLGVVNLTKAITLSSNVYFYTVGGGFGSIGGLGVDRLAAYYQKFGLGVATGIDLPEETKGRVPTPEWKQKVKKEAWFTGDTYNMSVGQGDTLVSPLQMAVATAAIANGGTVYKPYLVKAVTDEASKITKETKPEVVRKGFISPQNLAVVRDGMRQVVTSGTACCLIEQQVGVSVAAKTGTAETDPEGKRKSHAWFTAFAPYEDPQIVMVVLIENSGEGSQFAAPAVRETLAWYFKR